MWCGAVEQSYPCDVHRLINSGKLGTFPAKAGWSLRLERRCSGPGKVIPSCSGCRLRSPLIWGLLFVGNGLPLGFYFPRPGDVLICDYSTGFIAPEMVKRRPVVVVSGRERHGRKLCTVVPLSTTDPVPVEAWHHCLPVAIPGWNAAMCWAKCDMLATVSFDRLDKPHSKTRHGRTYHTVRLSSTDLLAVRHGVLSYLHF